MIIAFTAASYVHPMIRGSYKGNEIVQSTFSIHSVMTPFRNIIRAFFISPLMAKSCQSRVVIVHCDKRATRSRESIRSTAEVLDHSFAFGISGRSDVECSSRSLFLAKESSEWKAGLFSALSWPLLWEKLVCCLFHGMNSSLADETGELSCSTQVVRREANHLKSHKVPICHVSQQASNTDSNSKEREAYRFISI